MQITFLEAPIPLTKTYTKLLDGSVEKTSYPNVWEVSTSYKNVSNLTEFKAAIDHHAALGHCLLKGNTMRPLVKESRKDSTDRGATTEFICLDFDGINPTATRTNEDGAPVTVTVTVEYILNAMGLSDISYILQWSGSMGIGSPQLRCHVFIMLSQPMPAPVIKQWLIQKNHETNILREHQALTRTGCALTWGLDITACQTDKLIYIAPPIIKGMKNPLGNKSRISLVEKMRSTFALHAEHINSSDKNKQLTETRIAQLREKADLPKRKMTYKHVGNHEVLAKPGECTVTGMKTDRGFVYLNLDGGDSWGYFHPENNPDFVFNFKGEPTYLTKELLPSYWETLQTQAYRVTSAGTVHLAFLDRLTSTYYRGTYTPETDSLDILPAKNETMLRHYAEANGLRLGNIIPEWTIAFNPLNPERVDFDARSVNSFERTVYMKQEVKRVQACPKKIFSIIKHIMSDDAKAIDHFMNWLACIAQHLTRTRTAWVLHGTQGCLAGDTVLLFNRGKRNGGRPLTVKEAYQKWTAQFQYGTGKGRVWNPAITTFTKAVKDNMTIGYHEVFQIVESGVKQLYRLTTDAGHSIQVTELHPFLRPDGTYTPLNELSPGDVIIAEGAPLCHIASPDGRKARSTTYSIPYHPYAWKHIIAGKNYQRSHTARLVYEAAMNNMPFEEFVGILRTNPYKALTLKYLKYDQVIHHLDEDPSNDTLENLVVIDKANHDAHHAKEVGLGTISTRPVKIRSIEKTQEEMTYDLVMKAPYHNYVANGLVVHNTGKGILFDRVLAPIFGHNQTVIKRSAELNEKWTDFAENKFIIFIDEIQTSALQDEAGVIATVKSMIANHTIQIRALYKGAYSVPNFANWIFSSNQSDPVTVPKNDRRFNVSPYQSQPFPKPTDEWLDSLEAELPSFYNYLMSYEVDKERAATPLENEARSNLIQLSQTTAESTASAIQEGEFTYLLDQLPTDNTHRYSIHDQEKIDKYRRTLYDILARTRADGACNISRDELFNIFDYTVGGMNKSPTSFAKYLGHRQMHIQAVSIASRTVRGIQTTWKDPKDFSTHITNHFSDIHAAASAIKKAKATT